MFLPADAMKLLMERESVVRPITIAVFGVSSFEIAVAAKNKEAWAIELLSDSGSSLITGQPSRSANALTSSVLNPPRSWPTIKTPRSLLTFSALAAFVDLTLRGATMISSNHVVSESAASGSSN